MSLCMGENSSEDPTKGWVSAARGGDIQGATGDKLPPLPPLLSQSEVTIPGSDGRNHGGREFCFCCVACEERTFLCKVTFLDPISFFLNSVYKIIAMWRNLSCSLLASGRFLNTEFLLTPDLNALQQIKKQLLCYWQGSLFAHQMPVEGGRLCSWELCNGNKVLSHWALTSGEVWIHTVWYGADSSREAQLPPRLCPDLQCCCSKAGGPTQDWGMVCVCVC